MTVAECARRRAVHQLLDRSDLLPVGKALDLYELRLDAFQEIVVVRSLEQDKQFF